MNLQEFLMMFMNGKKISIDDGTTLNTYMKENNIKTYKD